MTKLNDQGDVHFMEALLIVATILIQAKLWAVIFNWTAADTGVRFFWYYLWLMAGFGILAESLRWSSALPVPMKEELFITKLTLHGVLLYLWFVPVMVLYVLDFFRSQGSISNGMEAVCEAALILFVGHSVSRTLHESFRLTRRRSWIVHSRRSRKAAV